MRALSVAFVWHMHQPYYKDDLTSTYLLPWVRLRSAKDYYKMPALLDAYPKVRATFNLVPSLLAQIEDYGKEESVDLFLNLSRREAGELSPEERDFLLRWMRESPRALRVQQSPRYLEPASRPPHAPRRRPVHHPRHSRPAGVVQPGLVRSGLGGVRPPPGRAQA